MAYQPKSYRKFVATAATATLVASAVAPAAAAGFTDVSDNYKEAVDFVVSKGAKGLTETRFGVSENIKRVDAAVLLANVLELDTEKAPAAGFTDVPARAQGAVNALKAAGITNGKSDTKFGANDLITRGELAIWIQKGFGLEGKAELKFTDVGSRYTEAVAALVANKITQGKSETQFGTADNAKRGDYAIFLHRAHQTLDVTPVAPEVVGVSAINSKQARVTFKGALPANVDFSNFEINGGLTVSAVELSTDRKSAVITVSSEFTRNQEYTVSVFGVKDTEGKEYPETKGTFTWEVAEGVTVALEATTLEQGQTVGITVKDEAGKDVKDARVKVESYNTNLVSVNPNNTPSEPSEVKITANNTKLAGTTDVVVETTLPDGSVLSNTFKVTVKEAVTTVTSAGYSLEADLTNLNDTMANTVAFKTFAKPTTSVVEGTGPFELAAFGETNGDPDTEHLNFTGATRVVSSNPIVATAVLDDDGITGVVKVNPLSPGTTTVTVTMKDGSRKTFPITVTATPVQKSISVNATTVKLSDESRKGTLEEGVNSQKVIITSLDQYDKPIDFVNGKVTVSSSTEGIELTKADGTKLVPGNNEVDIIGADNVEFFINAIDNTPVSNAKVTVSYFAKASDAKPTVTKTITVNVVDVDSDAITSSIDVVAPTEIDANYEISKAANEIDFTSTPVYALDSKGNRVEKLTLTTTDATIAEKDKDDKFVSVTNSKIAFKEVDDALTYLRASNTVNVEVTADGVKKVLPITYKNTAVVPNKATVSTSPVSIKLASNTNQINIEDIIFGTADADQLITDDLTTEEIIGVRKTAKNAGYLYNKPLVSITGTDGKTLATGVNVYGGALADFDANTFNNAIVEALKGYKDTGFASDKFLVDYDVANVNDNSTIVNGVVEPKDGKATTFTLVIKGIYVDEAIDAVEGVTFDSATAAQKAAHNLLSTPVQLNVSVSK